MAEKEEVAAGQIKFVAVLLVVVSRWGEWMWRQSLCD
jgi:hypothetical protein